MQPRIVRVACAAAGLVLLGCYADEVEATARVTDTPEIGRAQPAPNDCPEITEMSVAPLQAGVGEEILLNAEALDPEGDVIRFFWVSGDGTIAEPASARTTFTCGQLGENWLELQVSDGRDCGRRESIAVLCM